MSYKDILEKQIREIERKIKLDSKEKDILEKELRKLKCLEFEENMREENNQQLLKG
jgi:hypothetical protein